MEHVGPANYWLLVKTSHTGETVAEQRPLEWIQKDASLYCTLNTFTAQTHKTTTLFLGTRCTPRHSQILNFLQTKQL
jgi:hypothetical protein